MCHWWGRHGQVLERPSALRTINVWNTDGRTLWRRMRCFHHVFITSYSLRISYLSSVIGQPPVRSIYNRHILNKMAKRWHSIPHLVRALTGQPTKVLGSSLLSRSALTKIRIGQSSPFRSCQNVLNLRGIPATRYRTRSNRRTANPIACYLYDDKRENFRTCARRPLVLNVIVTAELGSQARTTVLTVVTSDPYRRRL